MNETLLHRPFFALLGLIALLMALGTPINRLLFFVIPGWAQTGSPARSLVIVAFCLSLLAAMGLEALLQQVQQGAAGNKATHHRHAAALLGVAVPVLLAALGASAAARFAATSVRGVPFGDLMALAMLGLFKACVLVALGACVLALAPRLPHGWRRYVGAACVLITAADLLGWGIGYNPSVPPDKVYPTTPGVLGCNGTRLTP
jgi:hypothetical protein